MKKQYRISIGVLAMVAVGCGGGGSYHYSPPAVTGSVATPNIPTVFNPPAGDSHTTTVTDPVTGKKTTVFTVQPTEPPVTLTNYPLPAGTTESDGVSITKVDIVIPSGVTITQGEPVALVPPTFPIDMDLGATNLAKSSRIGSRGDILLRSKGNWIESGFSLTGGKITEGGVSLQGKFLVVPADIDGSLGVQVVGPLEIRNTATNSKLTINGNTTVLWNKFIPDMYPVYTTYTLPSNGGVLTGSTLTMQFTGADPYASLSGTGTLTLPVSSTVTKVQNASVTNAGGKKDQVSFADPGTDSADAIPTNGIQSLTITLKLKR